MSTETDYLWMQYIHVHVYTHVYTVHVCAKYQSNRASLSLGRADYVAIIYCFHCKTTQTAPCLLFIWCCIVFKKLSDANTCTQLPGYMYIMHVLYHGVVS